MEVVFAAKNRITAAAVESGAVRWSVCLEGLIYSSPALADRGTPRALRREWPMFRGNPERTGQHPARGRPLDVYVITDAGRLYLLDGRTGAELDRFDFKFSRYYDTAAWVTRATEPIHYVSSPSVADLDGNGTLEVCFTLVDRVWCVEDRGSAANRPKDPPAPEKPFVEPVKKNTAATRNRFALGQLVHTGGWNPPVPVHEKLLEELAKRANLTAMSEMVPLSLKDDDVARFPFLYATGHEALALSDDEVKRLRGHLERGGLLFTEACCNAEPFEQSARALADKLWLGSLERLPGDHAIFTKVYDLREMKVARTKAPPEFWCIVRGGRVVFLFTNVDFGCSWGTSGCTSGCTGVSTEDSYRMLTNIVVYALLE